MPAAVLKCGFCRAYNKKCSLTAVAVAASVVDGGVTSPCDECQHYTRKCTGPVYPPPRQRRVSAPSQQHDVEHQPTNTAYQESAVKEIKQAVRQSRAKIAAIIEASKNVRLTLRENEHKCSLYPRLREDDKKLQELLGPELSRLDCLADKAAQLQELDTAELAYIAILDALEHSHLLKHRLCAARRKLTSHYQLTEQFVSEARLLQASHRDVTIRDSNNTGPLARPELTTEELEELISATERSNKAISSILALVDREDGRSTLQYGRGFPVAHILLGRGLLGRLPVVNGLSWEAVNIAFSTPLHSAIARHSDDQTITRLVALLPLSAFFIEDALARTPVKLAFWMGNEFAATAILDRFSHETPQQRRLLVTEYVSDGFRDQGEQLLGLATTHNFSHNVYNKIRDALEASSQPALWPTADTETSYTYTRFSGQLAGIQPLQYYQPPLDSNNIFATNLSTSFPDIGDSMEWFTGSMATGLDVPTNHTIRHEQSIHGGIMPYLRGIQGAIEAPQSGSDFENLEVATDMNGEDSTDFSAIMEIDAVEQNQMATQNG